MLNIPEDRTCVPVPFVSSLRTFTRPLDGPPIHLYNLTRNPEPKSKPTEQKETKNYIPNVSSRTLFLNACKVAVFTYVAFHLSALSEL
jgi:hypothetical protein